MENPGVYIRHHNDEQYSIIVSTYDETGKRKFRWHRRRVTEEDPDRFRLRITAAVLEGRYNPDDYRARPKRSASDGPRPPGPSRRTGTDGRRAISVADCVQKWYVGKQGQTIRERTLRRYASIVKYIDRSPIAALDAHKLSVPDVEGFRAWCFTPAGKSLAPKTVKETLVVLRAALARSKALGEIDATPFDVFRPGRGGRDQLLPYVPRHEQAVLEPVEVELVLAAVKGNHLEIPVRLALDAGPRVGEAVGVVFGDLDLSVPQLALAWQVGRDEERREEAKSHHHRVIPISPDTVALVEKRLKQHRQLCPRQGHGRCRLYVGPPGGSTDSAHAVSQSFGRLMCRLGLPGMTFHTLRHTFASRQILEGGVDARTLAEWLGHSDPGFTLRTYVHFFRRAEGKHNPSRKFPL